jgi:hypothetical protein
MTDQAAGSLARVAVSLDHPLLFVIESFLQVMMVSSGALVTTNLKNSDSRHALASRHLIFSHSFEV